MESPSTAAAADGGRHAANLSRSLRELQRAVREQEETLNRAQQEAGRSPLPSGGVESSVASFEIMTRAYQEAAESAPFIPFQDSVLPALLAMRRTQGTIAESRAYLESRASTVQQAKRRLDTEEANLQDQRALQRSLEKRIASLREDQESRQVMTREQITQQRLDELRLQKEAYDKDTIALLRAFKKFLRDHLGRLLAAEELGGPVVGEIMDIDSDGLAAGFSSRGALRKSNKTAKSTDPERRQRRIDQIWGSAEDRPGPGRPADEWDEAAGAGSDLQELTEELLNTLMESGGDSSAAYVRIERESAAARFLVRSRVAQFHPKDATRLRLVDFGRELDD